MISIEDKEDKQISWAVVIYLLTQAINMTIKTVLPVPERWWGMISAVFGLIIVYCFFRVFRIVYRRVNTLIFKVYGLFVILFIISAELISLREEPFAVLQNTYLTNVFVFWLPTGICAASIRNMSILYDTFLKTSYIIFVLALLCFWGGKVDSDGQINYNMQLGFTLIIPTLFHLNEVFKGRYKFLYLFFAEVAILIIYTNRGVLLSLAFFTFYKVFVEHKNYLFSFLIIVISAIVLMRLQTLSLFLLDVLATFNMSSRTLVNIVNNTLQESAGREEIWSICGEMLYMHPITGWGIGGECFQIFKGLGATSGFGYAYSPHNGILQLLLQFGIVFGLIAVIIFLLPIFKLHNIKNVSRKNMVLIFCSAIVIPCCYSAGDIFLKPSVAIYLFLFYCGQKTIDIKKS